MIPTDQLREEHEAIKSMLNVLEGVCDRLDTGEDVDSSDLDAMIDFFRIFADKCHHGKEETHLFPAMENAGVVREGGPIGVMLLEHDTGREYVDGMAEGAEKYASGDREGVSAFVENAKGYTDLLREHIDKENNILFPLAENTIPSEEKESLLEKFDHVEHEVVGEGEHERFHSLIERLQAVYGG